MSRVIHACIYNVLHCAQMPCIILVNKINVHTHTNILYTTPYPLHFPNVFVYGVHLALLDDGENWCGHRQRLAGAPTDRKDGVQSTEREVVFAGTAEDTLRPLYRNVGRGGGHLL